MALAAGTLLLLTACPLRMLSDEPNPVGGPASAPTSLEDGTAARSAIPPAPSRPGPDSTLEVPWNGTLWQSMPNFTWAACDVSAHTRQVIDRAFGEWAYAASNQDIPVQFSELPCSTGNSAAQIRLFEGSSTDLPGIPDVDIFGLTLARDANGRICGVDVVSSCVAVSARIYLFTDTWQSDELSYGQAAKTVAHELGHAIGLAHDHFCNFDSIMAQSCEPIFDGLGVADAESIDALVDYVRAYFNLPALHAQRAPDPPVSGGATVTYHAGYNLVAGPRGTHFSGVVGPLYTLLSGDAGYRSIPSSQATYDGYGYWAYFPQDVTVQLNGGETPFFSAVATPGKWFLVGNASASAAMRIHGADTVYVYDPQATQYRPSTTIQPGQAAWVRPNRDGFVWVVSTDLSQDQVRCYLELGDPSTC